MLTPLSARLLLTAFLSENFKKSFAKAFTCAAGKDVNAQLNVENSVFPRPTRGSTSARRSPATGKTETMDNFSSTVAAAVPLMSPAELASSEAKLNDF